MLVDTYIDKLIEQKLIAKNEEERKNREPSGKLSASMLNDPLQWQILKTLGVKPRELEEYVIRKFLRGKQVEEWILSEMPGIIETQKKVEYKDCIGFMDALVDTENWDWKRGVMPVEIKSVANSKFKRITDRGPDKAHILQACLYALAEDYEHFAVLYVAADDYRVKTYIYKTAEYKEEIDRIIDRFYKALKSGIVPRFEAVEKWQENLKYNRYPEWSGLDDEEIKNKIMEIKKITWKNLRT